MCREFLVEVVGILVVPCGCGCNENAEMVIIVERAIISIIVYEISRMIA